MSDNLLESENDVVPVYLLERSATLLSDERMLIQYVREHPDKFDKIFRKLKEFCKND